MNWYEILVMIVGAFGGTSGVLAWYNARSNRDSIDIGNLQRIIAEERETRALREKEHQQEKVEMKSELLELRSHIDRVDKRYDSMLLTVYQAYKCRFPDIPDDCPVIKSFHQCDQCHNKEDNHETK